MEESLEIKLLSSSFFYTGHQSINSFEKENKKNTQTEITYCWLAVTYSENKQSQKWGRILKEGKKYKKWKKNSKGEKGNILWNVLT